MSLSFSLSNDIALSISFLLTFGNISYTDFTILLLSSFCTFGFVCFLDFVLTDCTSVVCGVYTPTLFLISNLSFIFLHVLAIRRDAYD